MQSICLHAFLCCRAIAEAPLCKGGSAEGGGGLSRLRYDMGCHPNASIPPSQLRRATSLYTREALGGILLLPLHPKNFEFGISIEFILIKFLGQDIPFAGTVKLQGFAVLLHIG